MCSGHISAKDGRLPDAFNFILERCERFPCAVIYDFACGTLRSALGLSVKLLRQTLFFVDRFHFWGYKTCSLAMHSNSLQALNGRNTSSQEQRNNLIRPLERSLRGAKENNFMSISALAHALQNGKAMFRDHLDQTGQQRRSASRKGLGSTKQMDGWALWLRTLIESKIRK